MGSLLEPQDPKPRNPELPHGPRSLNAKRKLQAQTLAPQTGSPETRNPLAPAPKHRIPRVGVQLPSQTLRPKARPEPKEPPSRGGHGCRAESPNRGPGASFASGAFFLKYFCFFLAVSGCWPRGVEAFWGDFGKSGLGLRDWVETEKALGFS